MGSIGFRAQRGLEFGAEGSRGLGGLRFRVSGLGGRNVRHPTYKFQRLPSDRCREIFETQAPTIPNPPYLLGSLTTSLRK